MGINTYPFPIREVFDQIRRCVDSLCSDRAGSGASCGRENCNGDSGTFLQHGGLMDLCSFGIDRQGEGLSGGSGAEPDQS